MKKILATVAAALALAASTGVAQSLFDGVDLKGWIQKPGNSWTVKDASMASLGTARGFIYTSNKYTFYRVFFTMRHVGGNHQACVLIFGRSPSLDALGGIQFQVPNGGHWDYRPGVNNGGGSEFKSLPHPKFNPALWSRVEMLVNANTGTARMAVAQPVGTKAVEVLDFSNKVAGVTGPLAWQIHNSGCLDEYKDVTITINPKTPGLLSTQ